MRRLSGMDSMFVSLESPTTMFHVGSVAIFDPATVPPGVPASCEGLRWLIEQRLPVLTPFRRRLVKVPGGLGHPYWVDVDDVDLDIHIPHGSLPRPGGPKELAQYAADVLSEPLDQSRPLWEIHFVEGLEGGMVAGIAKIHHSLVDGIAGVELTANLMDLTPMPAELDAPEHEEETLPRGAPLEIAARSIWSLMGIGPRTVTTATRLMSRAAKIYAHNRQGDTHPPPALFSGPTTSINRSVGKKRSIGMAHVPREEVDEVRAAAGVTVNDVILALTAGALRSYLEEDCGEAFEQSLTAFVPVSVRTDQDTADSGVNKLSGMVVSLATTVEDPLERLTTINASARAAKAQDKIIGPTMYEDAAELLPPCVLGPGSRAMAKTGLLGRKPPFSVVISSFPGSPVPLYCTGARMVAYYPYGPIVDGVALNVTAMSYEDQIGFGLNACRETIPDVGAIGGRIPEALGMLTKETGR